MTLCSIHTGSGCRLITVETEMAEEDEEAAAQQHRSRKAWSRIRAARCIFYGQWAVAMTLMSHRYDAIDRVPQELLVCGRVVTSRLGACELCASALHRCTRTTAARKWDSRGMAAR